MDPVKEVLTRGVAAIYPNREALEKRLRSTKPLLLYLGIDPTGSLLHLGHVVVLRKLSQFQALGHQVILLFGDFTARIGDPTDKSTTRPRLTDKEVARNAADYKRQTAKILNFKGKNPARLAFNSQWHQKLTFADLIKIASYFTVQQLEEREMFQRRRKANKPIYLHEFLYPLLQAYDSLAMDVDLEIGGSDQIFNMLAGRNLMHQIKGKEKFVLASELLIGSDGKKMGKSLNNFIPVTATPQAMYGMLMAIIDEVLPQYLTLLTDLPLATISSLTNRIQKDAINPMEVKKTLALEVVSAFHGPDSAKQAQKEFERVFQKRLPPTEAPEIKVSSRGEVLLELITRAKLVSSKAEAKRLIKAGAVRLETQKITDPNRVIKPNTGKILKIGKLKFVKLAKQ